LNEDVDAAVASIITRGHRPEIVDTGNTNGTTAATVNMAVRERGRTTGVTYGVVHSVDTTIAVVYDPSIGTKVFRRQIGIRAVAPSTKFGDFGDSGSVAVNSARRVVGLYFADSDSSGGVHGAANHIHAVLSNLNIRL
jgi:hypothetical protein